MKTKTVNELIDELVHLSIEAGCAIYETGMANATEEAMREAEFAVERLKKALPAYILESTTYVE